MLLLLFGWREKLLCNLYTFNFNYINFKIHIIFVIRIMNAGCCWHQGIKESLWTNSHTERIFPLVQIVKQAFSGSFFFCFCFILLWFNDRTEPREWCKHMKWRKKVCCLWNFKISWKIWCFFFCVFMICAFRYKKIVMCL